MEKGFAQQFFRCGGDRYGTNYYEKCRKAGEGLHVLCGWKRESLSRKNGSRRKEKEGEKEKEVSVEVMINF